MLWQDSEQITRTLEIVFNQILTQRMQGLPVVNKALSVQATRFYLINTEWLGILITPWFMNVLLLPGQDSTWLEQNAGLKFAKVFPFGVFEFTLAKEDQLGVYAQCSLFSPMFQFSHQADALAAAEAALQGLLSSPQPRNLSRRDLLRGAIGNIK